MDFLIVNWKGGPIPSRSSVAYYGTVHPSVIMGVVVILPLLSQCQKECKNSIFV